MFINAFGHKFTIQKVKNLLFSSTIIVTISVLIGAFFSYILQFLLARYLSVSDFGTFNSLLSLTYLIGVPASVFSASIIKMSSELLAKKNWDKITKLFWKLNFYFFIVGLFLAFLIVIFNKNIASFLNISDFNLLIPFAVFLGISYIQIVPGSYLQGLLRFKAFSFYTILNSFFRTFIPLIFIMIGFSIYGVFYGFTIAILISFIVSYLLLQKNLSSTVLYQQIDLKENYKKIISFSSSVVFINFGLMALNNLDMIMVKSFFDQDVAGYYAGTVTLGKILLFGAGTVSAVMFPQISNLYIKKSKTLYKKFKSFLYIQILFVILGFLFFSIFPEPLTRVFFGDRFLQSIKYLPLFSLFISLYILVNFMVLFFMAIDKTKVFVFLILASVIQFILLNIFNQTIFHIIFVNIFVTFVLLITLFIYYEFKVKKTLDLVY